MAQWSESIKSQFLMNYDKESIKFGILTFPKVKLEQPAKFWLQEDYPAQNTQFASTNCTF